MEGTNLIILMLVMLFAGFAAASVFFITLYGGRSRHKTSQAVEERTDQFTSLASHYLLNPITVIQTALASLQERDTSMTTEQRGVLYEAIQRGQQRLWIVAQQLMVVGEVDRNTLVLKLGVADLYETVSGAVAAVDPFARAKQVSFHIDDHTQDIKEARFDVRRLKQAIIAVVDNAVKFSPDGGKVLVTIVLDHGYFVITVDDGGIGMSQEILSHASEKFYRGTEMYTFNYEGIGLGLYIAQAIMRLHGGNISIVSKPNQGTSVAIQFPQL